MSRFQNKSFVNVDVTLDAAQVSVGNLWGCFFWIKILAKLDPHGSQVFFLTCKAEVVDADRQEELRLLVYGKAVLAGKLLESCVQYYLSGRIPKIKSANGLS